MPNICKGSLHLPDQSAEFIFIKDKMGLYRMELAVPTPIARIKEWEMLQAAIIGQAVKATAEDSQSPKVQPQPLIPPRPSDTTLINTVFSEKQLDNLIRVISFIRSHEHD